jgi:flagellar biosynthetic protein FliS
MNPTNAAATYRHAQFESAPPIKIVQMLNAGAIRLLRTARELPSEDPEHRKSIRAAEEIVSELRASLNHDPSPALSANLEGLYVFMQRELARTLLEGDPTGIDASIRILSTLLEGWQEAGAQVTQGQIAASQGHVA